MATITGTEGDDFKKGTILADDMDGLAGDDRLDGGRSNDTIIGGTGRDELIGGIGDDTFIVEAGEGALGEIYSGGSGLDTFRFNGTLLQVTLDLRGSVLTGIERILFATAANASATLLITEKQEALNAGLEIIGTAGKETLEVDIGLPSGDADLSDLQFFNWSTTDSIVVKGSAGSNEIIGSSHADTIKLLGAGDTVDAASGNDIFDFESGESAESVEGGSGTDTLKFDDNFDFRAVASSGIERILVDGDFGDSITINLLASQFGNDAVKDLAVSINRGTSVTLDFEMDTELTFSARQFTFGTGLFFGRVNLKVTGDGSSETIGGSSNNDTLLGRGGTDSLTGGQGNDLLNGGSGDDQMAGGSGNDTYVVDSAGETTSEFSFLNDAGGIDAVISSVNHVLGTFIENLTLSGTGAIDGDGNVLGNRIDGNGNANTLRGLGGADTLLGGKGADILIGGQGGDTLVFTQLLDSLAGAGRDSVIGFNTGADTIDVSAIDADLGTNGLQHFELDANGILKAGEFQLREVNGNTIIDFEADGISGIDMQIFLEAVTGVTAGDFILA